MAVSTLRPPASAGEGPQLHPVPDALSGREPGPRARRDEPAGRAAAGDPANDPEYLATWFAVYLAVLLFSMLGLGGIWISYFAL